jgi:prolyl 4-hydroxylase
VHSKDRARNSDHWVNLLSVLFDWLQEHHDFLPEMTQWPCGVRLATFFLYLSDVEEGGGTWFPRLNVTGVPKKGRALLWYNVQKDASGEWKMDGRTQHEAVPVIKGTKYAANKWIHVKDWVTPWRAGRTG